jgi:hypothetical protein
VVAEEEHWFVSSADECGINECLDDRRAEELGLPPDEIDCAVGDDAGPLDVADE